MPTLTPGDLIAELAARDGRIPWARIADQAAQRGTLIQRTRPDWFGTTLEALTFPVGFAMAGAATGLAVLLGGDTIPHSVLAGGALMWVVYLIASLVLSLREPRLRDTAVLLHGADAVDALASRHTLRLTCDNAGTTWAVITRRSPGISDDTHFAQGPPCVRYTQEVCRVHLGGPDTAPDVHCANETALRQSLSRYDETLRSQVLASRRA